MTHTITCDVFNERLLAYLEHETDDPTRAAMERHVVGRLRIVGAELCHIQRFEIVRRHESLARLDRFTERVRYLLWHRRVNHHGPAAEVHCRHVCGQRGKPRFGQDRGAIADHSQFF